MNQIRVAIIGCGAITQQYQGPAARVAEQMRLIQVTSLVDRDSVQIAACQQLFPEANGYSNLDAIPEIDVALIATPAKLHSKMTTDLLNRGVHVLVEKPMAGTVAEAELMNQAALDTQKVLAIGQFRRFFPAVEAIKQLVDQETLGKAISVRAAEGSQFRWPAASPSFFIKEESGGGVLLDIGIHMLDLLIHWFGIPTINTYEDDAMGGVEINARGSLRWPTGMSGTFRLSWDIQLSNTYIIEFEKGTVKWKTNTADTIEVIPKGVDFKIGGKLASMTAEGATVEARNYISSFTAQWKDVVEAIQQSRRPRVTGEDAIQALRLVEALYGEKKLMPLPHLSGPEQQAAAQGAAR